MQSCSLLPKFKPCLKLCYVPGASRSFKGKSMDLQIQHQATNLILYLEACLGQSYLCPSSIDKESMFLA